MKKFAAVIFISVIVVLSGCQKDSDLQLSDKEEVNAVTAAPEDNTAVDETDSREVIPSETTTPAKEESNSSAGDIIEIKEKMFVAQSDDIYYNSKEYLGKTIKYEGFFQSAYWESDSTTHNFVIRNSPGCCGDDGQSGFEVTWDGDWPEDGEWCEVVGILEEYPAKNWNNLRLSLTALTVLDERGADFVYQ